MQPSRVFFTVAAAAGAAAALWWTTYRGGKTNGNDGARGDGQDTATASVHTAAGDVEEAGDVPYEVMQQLAALVYKANEWSRKAVTHLNAGELQEAVAAWEQARQLCARTGHRRAEASMCANMSQVLLRDGDALRALEYAEADYAISSGLQDVGGMMRSLADKGNAHRLLGETMKAVEAHVQRLQVARAGREGEEAARATGDVATCYMDVGEWAKARDCFLRMLDIARSVQSVNQCGVAYVGLVEVLGKLQEAASGNEAAHLAEMQQHYRSLAEEWAENA